MQEEETTPMIPWPKAHLETCVELKCLYATPQEVLTRYPPGTATSLPLAGSAVVLSQQEFESVSKALTERYIEKQQKEALQEQQEEATTSKASRFNRFTSTLSGLWGRILYGEDYDEEVEQALDYNDSSDQDNLENSEELLREEVGWTDRVVHVDLAIQCTQALVECIQQGQAVFFLRLEKDESSKCRTRQTLVSWCRLVGKQSENNILQETTQEQAEMLAHVLVALHKAKFMELDNGTRILALFDVPPDPNKLELLLELYKLDSAMESTQQRIEHYTRKAQEAGQRALHLSNSKQTKMDQQIKRELQKRKLYLRQVEQSKDALLQMEQVRLALESSQDQKELLEMLEESAIVLQQTNVDTDAVDEVVDDLQEELQHLQAAHDTHAAAVSSEHVDEDELIQELQQLDLSEAQVPKAPNHKPNKDEPTKSVDRSDDKLAAFAS